MRRGPPAEPEMASLSIAELTDRFPDFRVALVVAEGLSVGEARGALLQGEIEAIEAECRRRWSGVELSAIPGVAAWRAAYKGFGVKKTSYRSSVERLVKRVVAGGALPQVNALVDLYNAVSLQAGLVSAATISTLSPRSRLSLFAPRPHVRRHGAEAGEAPTIRRNRARSFTPIPACAAPAMELARGRAQRRLDALPAARAHRPVDRLRRRRGRRGRHRRSD